MDHKDPQMARMEEDTHPGAIGPERPTDGQDGGGPIPRSKLTQRTHRRPGWRRTHIQEQPDQKDPQDPWLGRHAE